MILKSLRVEKFKRIDTVDIVLNDVTVLVGANGSGKSSIIQAIHLACCVLRQAYRVEATRTSTVGIDELDYLPSDNYKMLGHKANWGNKSGTPSSKVSLNFTDNGMDYAATCELRSARNAGISITGTVAGELSDLLRKKTRYFSAYIPGISGIPNSEERRGKKVILKACSYGDSNVILRNALLLLKELDEDNLRRIEGWIQRIIGPVSITVQYDDERDFIVHCMVTIDGDSRPLELIGTGYLQLLQIFSYVLLFKPGILLIDEPDIHLHPTIQERLVPALAQVALEENLKVLLTTHSPFIVRGAPANTTVYWVQDGAVRATERQAVELALGWGIFGKKIIIASEDSDTSQLRKLLSQWPELERSVAFVPGTGYANNPTPEQTAKIKEALGESFKLLVHRDRDALTDDEAIALTESYVAAGVDLYLPLLSDVEAYFCQSQFLEELLNCTHQEALDYVESILQKKAVDIKAQFAKQRTAHNAELHKAGGSPTNDDVWNAFQQRELRGAKGKFVFKQLQNAIPNQAFSEAKIAQHALSGTVAMDLKHKIEQLLAQ
jgi:ABC-type lipoprotein export system ATPase subunit